jgi:hypothetical protein
MVAVLPSEGHHIGVRRVSPTPAKLIKKYLLKIKIQLFRQLQSIHQQSSTDLQRIGQREEAGVANACSLRGACSRLIIILKKSYVTAFS